MRGTFFRSYFNSQTEELRFEGSLPVAQLERLTGSVMEKVKEAGTKKMMISEKISLLAAIFKELEGM